MGGGSKGAQVRAKRDVARQQGCVLVLLVLAGGDVYGGCLQFDHAGEFSGSYNSIEETRRAYPQPAYRPKPQM